MKLSAIHPFKSAFDYGEFHVFISTFRVSEGLASYDLSVEGEEKRTAIKRRIAQLEQEEYEWQAKQKQTH